MVEFYGVQTNFFTLQNSKTEIVRKIRIMTKLKTWNVTKLTKKHKSKFYIMIKTLLATKLKTWNNNKLKLLESSNCHITLNLNCDKTLKLKEAQELDQQWMKTVFPPFKQKVWIVNEFLFGWNYITWIRFLKSMALSIFGNVAPKAALFNYSTGCSA